MLRNELPIMVIWRLCVSTPIVRQDCFEIVWRQQQRNLSKYTVGTNNSIKASPFMCLNVMKKFIQVLKLLALCLVSRIYFDHDTCTQLSFLFAITK